LQAVEKSLMVITATPQLRLHRFYQGLGMDGAAQNVAAVRRMDQIHPIARILTCRDQAEEYAGQPETCFDQVMQQIVGGGCPDAACRWPRCCRRRGRSSSDRIFQRPGVWWRSVASFAFS
jgi:hypothetical protein